MEVIVRNLDQLADLIVVFFERLRLHAPRTGVLYPALLACLLYATIASRAESTISSVHAPMQSATTDRPTHDR